MNLVAPADDVLEDAVTRLYRERVQGAYRETVDAWVARGCPVATLWDHFAVTALERLDPESLLARDARRRALR